MDGDVLVLLLLQSLLGGRQDAYDLQPDASMGAGLRTSANGLSKIFTFEPQWLCPVDIGDSGFAFAIRDHRISMYIRTGIVHLNHFRRIGIIVDDHTHIADDGHLAD